jgi:two-component system, chemotaxis family, response regulator PixG
MKPELDPYSILSHLSRSRTSGCLEISYKTTKWSVILQLGQLLSVDCSVESLDRLIHQLYQLGCDVAAKAVNTNAESSGNLSGERLVRQEIDRLTIDGLLNRTQASQVSMQVTKEALESLLWLKTGSCRWQQERLTATQAIKNTESRIDLSKLIEYYQQRLIIWQKYIPIVQSPHQRPYVINHRLLEKPVAAGALSSKALNQIAQLMKGISLRELAMWLKQDELKAIQLLVPYIREQVICLREPSSSFQHLPLIPEPDLPDISVSNQITLNHRSHLDPSSEIKTHKKIAYIDDSPFMLHEMENIFGKNSKYSLTKIDDPVKAAAMIFRLKPDLILMDITMPDINGYHLCRLFRSSATLETTPIIMVTGNKGLINKARAKLVGATDYLTKPFTAAQILELVEKYLV